MDIEVRLIFSIRPPTPHNGGGVAYPFPKNLQGTALEGDLMDEPSVGLPPPHFLEELVASPTFSFHIGIGLPENDVLPTLSYSDFFRLSSNNNLNWTSIIRYIHEKYELLSKDDNSDTPKRFMVSLKKHFSNSEGEKSVLLFPGRWVSTFVSPNLLPKKYYFFPTSKFL
jgi:hypothetical protein